MNYSHEPLTGERVRVDRGNGQVFEANCTHKLYYEVMREGKAVGRGAFLAMGIRTDRGHDLYCQMDQVSPV